MQSNGAWTDERRHYFDYLIVYASKILNEHKTFIFLLSVKTMGVAVTLESKISNDC